MQQFNNVLENSLNYANNCTSGVTTQLHDINKSVCALYSGAANMCFSPNAIVDIVDAAYNKVSFIFFFSAGINFHIDTNTVFDCLCGCVSFKFIWNTQ